MYQGKTQKWFIIVFNVYLGVIVQSQQVLPTRFIAACRWGASRVLANYQWSLLPREMWSLWDDNMAIHYSSEQGASCRLMGRNHQKPDPLVRLRALQAGILVKGRSRRIRELQLRRLFLTVLNQLSLILDQGSWLSCMVVTYHVP